MYDVDNQAKTTNVVILSGCFTDTERLLYTLSSVFGVTAFINNSECQFFAFYSLLHLDEM